MRIASVALVAALAALLGPLGSASGRIGPHISVSSETPLAIHGSGFGRGERVTVTAAVAGHIARRTVTAVRGMFTVRFVNLSATPCSSYRVVATGSLGTKVSIRLVPECAPGPTA